jgi:hypothetical protein
LPAGMFINLISAALADDFYFLKMALYTELPVYRDTYKLVLEIFVSTKNFPKEYKYSLGRDMERDVLVLMRCIYRALLERNFRVSSNLTLGV